MALPTLRTERPMSLWTRIVALISLLLVLGVVVTGSLSLFLLNRTLIQSVDNNLQSSVSEMLALAQSELAGDDEDDIELSALLAEVGSEFGDVSVVCRVAISQRRVPVFVQQNSL